MNLHAEKKILVTLEMDAKEADDLMAILAIFADDPVQEFLTEEDFVLDTEDLGKYAATLFDGLADLQDKATQAWA